jgi:hypothetical protein
MPNHQRLLTLQELALLLYMLRGKPNVEHLLACLPTAQVEELSDGGMGSLLFVSSKPNRMFGEVIAEIQFNDEDNVPVLASLNLDKDGALFELDLFKADFSPLKKLPVF